MKKENGKMCDFLVKKVRLSESILLFTTGTALQCQNLDASRAYFKSLNCKFLEKFMNIKG